MKNTKHISELLDNQMNRIEMIGLKNKLELHIQQLSGLVLGANNERVILQISSSLASLRDAVNILNSKI